MPVPNLTSVYHQPNQPLDRLELSNPQVAALFLKINVTGYLAQFIGAETTVKQAATQLGIKLNVMAYWTERFLHFGLIDLTRTERRGGSAIKHYQSVANEFIVPVDLIEGTDHDQILQLIMQRDYQRFSHSVVVAGRKLTPDWRLRLFRDRAGHGLHLEPIVQPAAQAMAQATYGVPMQRPLHDWARIALPAQQASEFHRELYDLFERFRAAATPEPDAVWPCFTMHVGFVEDAG
jgi:hypothetical protein